MQARISPRVTRRWLRESRKCHKSNPEQLIHTNLLSRPTGSGIVMPASGLTLFRGSHSHKESAAALKLDEGGFLYLISCVRARRSPSISPPIEKHFGAKSHIAEARYDWVLTTPHHGNAPRHRDLRNEPHEVEAQLGESADQSAPRDRRPRGCSPHL